MKDPEGYLVDDRYNNSRSYQDYKAHQQQKVSSHSIESSTTTYRFSTMGFLTRNGACKQGQKSGDETFSRGTRRWPIIYVTLAISLQTEHFLGVQAFHVRSTTDLGRKQRGSSPIRYPEQTPDTRHWPVTLLFQERQKLSPPLPTELDNEFASNGEMDSFPLESEAGDDEISVYSCAVDFSNNDIAAPYMSRMESEYTFVDFTDDGLCVPAGPVGQFKERTANFLAEPIVEITVALSVLLNSLLVALSTLDVDFLSQYQDWIRTGELAISILFCLDFVGRWLSSCKDTGKHVLNAQFTLDVLVVILPLVVGLTPASFWIDTPLPSWLTSPSGLFNLELLRVLRLNRFLTDLTTFERFVERALGVEGKVTANLSQEWQLQLARVLLSLFTLVSVATGLIYTAENAVNPAINNYFDALYFGLTTLTTVGFGDIYPITWQGKLVVCGSILVGVAVVPAQAASLVEALLAREDAKTKSFARNRASIDASNEGTQFALDAGKTCPQCGAPFHWTTARFCYSCGYELR